MKTLISIFRFCCFSFLFLITTVVYSQNDTTETSISDDDLLVLYEDLRVADVSDGMDMVGLPDVGLMHQSIEALWKNIDNFAQMFCGIAITARYVPTNKIVNTSMTKKEFQEWEGNWYNTISDEPYVKFIKPGSVILLDVEGDGDTGSVGSYNSLD